MSCHSKVFPLVGSEAMNFTASAVTPDGAITENFEFQKYVSGCMCVLFFYPLDFTFVCPSEIISLDQSRKEFESRNVKVVLVSVDSVYSHFFYRQMKYDQGGIGEIGYHMVSDANHKISKHYGILTEGSVALRATFIIDQDFKIRHQTVNDLAIGRSVDEIVRLVDAIEFVRENGEVCPMNWKKGSSGMKPTVDGMRSYLSNNFKK